MAYQTTIWDFLEPEEEEEDQFFFSCVPGKEDKRIILLDRPGSGCRNGSGGLSLRECR